MSDSKLFAESLLMFMSSGPQHLIISILDGKCDPVNKKNASQGTYSQHIIKNPGAFALSATREWVSKNDTFLVIVAKIWARDKPNFLFNKTISSAMKCLGCTRE